MKSSLVLLDNRDEVLSRPTAPAHWWQNSDVFAPQDLQRSEKGTWIGITRSGRFSVLVNLYEDTSYPKLARISRGALPRKFLESRLSPCEWVLHMKSKCAKELALCGGFTLVVGTVDPDTLKVELDILSNIEDSKAIFPDLTATFTLSNGCDNDRSWTKRDDLYSLYQPLLKVSDHDKFNDLALKILQTLKLPSPTARGELRRHIFIPAFNTEAGAYGTKTQTIITVDKSGLVTYNEYDVVSSRLSVEQFLLSRYDNTYSSNQASAI